MENQKKIALELYKLVAETRKFEIDNFWKRALFFWGALAILLVGYFQVKEQYSDYLIFISFLTCVYTLIFSLSLRGSKFWQENWEQKVLDFQNQLKSIYNDSRITFDIFGIPLHERIRRKEKDRFPLVRAFRFSVSKLPLLISDITLLVTFILFLKDVLHLIKKIIISSLLEKLEFLKPLVILIIMFFILLLTTIYFIIFLKEENSRNKGNIR